MNPMPAVIVVIFCFPCDWIVFILTFYYEVFWLGVNNNVNNQFLKYECI